MWSSVRNTEWSVFIGCCRKPRVTRTHLFKGDYAIVVRICHLHRLRGHHLHHRRRAATHGEQQFNLAAVALVVAVAAVVAVVTVMPVVAVMAVVPLVAVERQRAHVCMCARVHVWSS